MNSNKGTYVGQIMINYEPWPTALWNGSVLWNNRQCSPDQCTRIISCSINEMKSAFKSMTVMMYDLFLHDFGRWMYNCLTCFMIWMIYGHLDVGDMCLCLCSNLLSEPWFMIWNWIWLYDDTYDFLQVCIFIIISMNKIWECTSMTWWL